jgi:hypothetical protein
MKKSAVVLLVALFTLGACQSPITRSEGTGTLNITFGLSGSRTILPDFLGQAAQLKVTLNGPEGYSETLNLGARDNARFTDLSLGTYNAGVQAINFSGQVFLTGAKTFDVGQGNNTVNLDLESSMDGSGSLQVDISYPSTAGVDEIQTRTYLLGTTPGPWVSVTDLDGGLSLSEDLPSGYYFFEIQFYSNSTLLAGIYEVAWVFDNSLSQQSFSLPLGFEVPAPPSAFLATESGEEVHLSWVDESLTETGFRLERKTTDGSWSLLASLPAGSETFTDGSTEASTAYSYRLRAEGASANSPWVSLNLLTGDRQGEEGDLTITITVTDPVDLMDIFTTIGDLGEAEVTVNAAVQGATSWSWHLNGNLVSNQSSYTFDSSALPKGLHILALIVEVEGEIFSESVSFKVDKAESLTINSLTIDGQTILPQGTAFAIELDDDRSSLIISAITEDPTVIVSLDGLALPTTLSDLPANGASQSYLLIVTGASGAEKNYSLEISRDYMIDEAIDIYYYSEGSTAPAIWFWEEGGIALASALDFTWPGPNMVDQGDNWWHFGIPTSEFTPGFPYPLELIINADENYTIDPVQDVYIRDGVITPADAEDTVPPVLTWSPQDLTTTEPSLVVSLSVTDNLDPNPMIYYTEDGSLPSESSNLYTSAFIFTSSTLLRVYVVDESGNGAYYDLSIEVGVIPATEVSAIPGNGEFYTDSLTITLGLKGSGISSATYSLSTGDSGSFADGDQLNIDASNLAVGDIVSLELNAIGAGGSDTASYSYTKAEIPEGFYATNPNGQKGRAAAITIDGEFDDWSNDMIIAQGVANDDPRMFKGSHEGPVYDLYALYASWDDDKLYLMWQYTNVTDVADPAQGFPISDNGKPWNGNIPISIAFDIDPSLETDGIIDGTQTSVWGDDIYNTFANGMDRLAMFSSKPGVGEPAIFTMNANGALDYEVENILAFEDYGISFLYGDGFKPETMMGINSNGWAGYKPEDLLDLDRYIDFLETSHNTAQDTMYEMQIPFTALGIDRATLESQGIGIMLVSTFGQSGIGSLPDDPANLDNVMEDYGPDSSTSAEKSDADHFTRPMARIGQ